MKDEDTSWTMFLSDDENKFNIPKLLRKVGAELSDAEKKKGVPIVIERLQLDSPSTSGDKPGISFSFSFMDDENVALQKDNLDFRREIKAATEIQEVKFLSNDLESLQCMEVRLPQGDEQNNSVRLLERVAKEIEEQKVENILDLIYQEFCDDDGLQHPFIRVYYAQSFEA